MKNIALIVLTVLLAAMVGFVYLSEKRYQSLNDEFWLAKVDRYLLSTSWLTALESEGSNVYSAAEVGQSIKQSIKQNINQDQALFELCLIEKCVSDKALRLMNNMLSNRQ